jgi:hypothetical protein
MPKIVCLSKNWGSYQKLGYKLIRKVRRLGGRERPVSA